MAFSKVSGYAIGDTNFDNMMLTLDKAYKGKMSLSLTEYTTATIPEIAAGSWVEVNGALFETDSNVAISTTDPVNGGTVANGTVYVTLVPSGDSCTAGFVDTAPTWSDSKQGYYYTGDYANYRAVGRALKATSSYTYKSILNFNSSVSPEIYISNNNLYTTGDLVADDLIKAGTQLTSLGTTDLYGNVELYGTLQDTGPNTGEVNLRDYTAYTIFENVRYAYITVYKPISVKSMVGTTLKLTSSNFSADYGTVHAAGTFALSLNPGYYKTDSASANCSLYVYGIYGQEPNTGISHAVIYTTP